MIAFSQKNIGNYPGKCFRTNEKETEVKILPWVTTIGQGLCGVTYHAYKYAEQGHSKNVDRFWKKFAIQ